MKIPPAREQTTLNDVIVSVVYGKRCRDFDGGVALVDEPSLLSHAKSGKPLDQRPGEFFLDFVDLRGVRQRVWKRRDLNARTTFPIFPELRSARLRRIRR